MDERQVRSVPLPGQETCTQRASFQHFSSHTEASAALHSHMHCLQSLVMAESLKCRVSHSAGVTFAAPPPLPPVALPGVLAVPPLPAADADVVPAPSTLFEADLSLPPHATAR
jgi:hypothetical protein